MNQVFKQQHNHEPTNVGGRFFIKSFGCQMNVADSDRMTSSLESIGMSKSAKPDDADLIILNTCHIREKASEKLFSELGRMRDLPLPEHLSEHLSGKRRIGVVGCVAQAMGELILERAPYVDFVLGPQSIQELIPVIAKLDGNLSDGLNGNLALGKKQIKPKPVIVDFDVVGKFHAPYEPPQDLGISAFLTVQEGCDQFCSFCVVPYTRGKNYSRPLEQIKEEAKTLAKRGVKEITLIGQNVNSYAGEDLGGKTRSLAELFQELGAAVPEILRWRYATSHPVDMSDDLITLHGSMPSLMPYLHLPIQSGSDKILKLMNRKHTVDDYRRIVDKLRTARSDLALTTDIIVGHPQESDEDFAMTIRAIEEFAFVNGYSFKYSPRPGTPSAMMAKQIPPQVQSDRLESLQCLLNASHESFIASFLNKSIPVLFEKAGRKAGQYKGRSAWMHGVHAYFERDPRGQEIPCLVTEVLTNSLSARPMLTNPTEDFCPAHA